MRDIFNSIAFIVLSICNFVTLKSKNIYNMRKRILFVFDEQFKSNNLTNAF